MLKNKEHIYQLLHDLEIYSPTSGQTLRHEKSLSRYFEKEYIRYIETPVSIESINISADKGPIMEATDKLMENHYDENIDFFKSFLDTKYKAYSMAYYGEKGEINRSLEEAQAEKFKLICDRLKLNGNETILNIGCGFGSLETYLFTHYPDLKITGITPSNVQINYLKQKIQDPNHSFHKNFNLIEGTIDDLPIDTIGARGYDIVISIGVCEHVHNIKALMKLIAKLLKPKGKTFHHFITSQAVIPQFLNPTKTLFGEYFPGGRIWPHDEFLNHSEYFEIVNTWFVNGNNYWRTLNDWHKRYWKKVPDLYGDKFEIKDIKYWNDYFSLGKATYSPLEGTFFGNSQYLFRLKD